MAVDTFEKRLSLIGYGIRLTLPVADGGFNVGDRLHLLGLYAGEAGSPVVEVSTPAVGWYADDDGLVEAWSAAHLVYPGEQRGYWMDFSPMAEILAGDTIGTPTVAVLPSGGPAISSASVTGSRVFATILASVTQDEGMYRIEYTVPTDDGSTLVRSGPIWTQEFDDLTTPTMGDNDVALQPGPGWYASNDGLVNTWQAPHRIGPAETRRYWMDFGPVDEIVAGDTINAGPTVSSSPSGLTFANVAVSGTRVLVDITGATVNTLYLAVFSIVTSGGAVVVRAGQLRCANL